MDNIVEELIRIEDKANQYMADSEKGRLELSARSRTQLRELKASLEAETREKIQRLTEDSAGEIQAALQSIAAEGEKKMRYLEQDFADNRKSWEDAIVDRILHATE